MSKKNNIKVIQTARDTGDRLTPKEDLFFTNDTPDEEMYIINIYDDFEYQTIEGFGGAFTEAASTTLDKMSKEKRNEILNAYFNPETGLGYTFCRTHINSCDFSLGNYSYVEENDVELKTFNIDRDLKSLIPFIKDAMAVEGADFKLFASPWSPPAWMKTNGMMNNGGKLKEEYYDAWARYYVKYIEKYREQGINIWGISVQNEAKAIQRWDSCTYTAEEERDFVKNYLGPTFEKEGLRDVKIIIWDHNKERVYERSKVVYMDPEASKYVWGTGFHWYTGDHFEALALTHEKFPEKKLLFTEGCQEGGVKLGSWNTAERYGHDIIGNLNNWTVGWVDWNLLLNEQGGPNHVGNYCDAPIIADTTKDKVIYESSFYYIGHFSKYIRPGAKRIGFSKYTDKLEVTAFKNTDGKIVVVIMNRSDLELPFRLRTQAGMAMSKSLPHSIVTLCYE